MYQEWMEGVPLLFKGFKEHNLSQLARARDYYERKGNKELAECMQRAIEKYC